ncbi:PAS domain S-box protein [Alienimonas sp. DA493]|uniref:PAS domain S-box protein n=1 Tax=Alienimonas sp. DA493 TaxID=3373605 RepID=UPI003753FD57
MPPPDPPGPPPAAAREGAAEPAARLRGVLDAAVDAILTIDERGRIESINPAGERLFGYTAGELLGRNVAVLMPSPYRAEHDGYVARYLRTGTPHIIGIGRQVEGLRSDGSTFPMHLAVSEVTLDDRRLFTGIIRDLTDQKRIEAELDRRELQIRFMIENLPAGAVYADRAGGTLLCNPTVQRITGYPRDRLSTLDGWFGALYPDDPAGARAAYETDRDDQFELTRTTTYRHADGTDRVMETTGYRYHDHEVWLIRDVTASREAEKRAVQAERLAAIGQMVAGLAHESRNALQRARAGLDVLALDAGPGGERALDRVGRALSDLTTLYEEVRQYAAPIALRREPMSLRTVWRRAWASLADRRAADGAAAVELIEVGAKQDPAAAEVDPFRMEQVFRNLFENALDAVAEARRAAAGDAGDAGDADVEPAAGATDDDAAPGAVTVEVVSGPGRGDEFDVCVRDDGRGLDEAAAARVFEPFFTTKQKGTGLGMAIVGRIVDLHDARIRAERAESGGACFRLTFARTDRPPHDGTPSESRESRS